MLIYPSIYDNYCIILGTYECQTKGEAWSHIILIIFLLKLKSVFVVAVIDYICQNISIFISFVIPIKIHHYIYMCTKYPPNRPL